MSLERQTGQRRWSLNPIGLLFGAVPLLLSLTPSLLPRPATLQGLGSRGSFSVSGTPSGSASRRPRAADQVAPVRKSSAADCG